MNSYVTGLGLITVQPNPILVLECFPSALPRSCWVSRAATCLHAVFQEICKCPRSFSHGMSMWGSKDGTQKDLQAWAGIFSAGKSNRSGQIDGRRTPANSSVKRNPWGFFHVMMGHVAHEREVFWSSGSDWPPWSSLVLAIPWMLISSPICFLPSLSRRGPLV